MSNYRPIDSKREEFRKYLERAGVMDALTKVLVSLYEEPEKPDDALDYVRKHLAEGSPDTEDVETLKNDLEASKARVEILEQENASLKEKLSTYEPASTPEAPPAAEDASQPEDHAEATPEAETAAAPEGGAE
ncbi:c-Myc-binding protein [Periplaneta americana]|uniref:c-Myc-binding protein n=1 Tax=Periplaneta americana TaxID=6978 RepID=UPI0037E861FF